jgi:RNA polymerase sigma factor (sigma-70 family)
MARRKAAERASGATGVAGDFELTPEVEAALDALARAARHDAAARNELYAALELKIARFLAPYRGRTTAAGEFEDLAQEAFLVFVDLVAGWRGEGSFARYFLGFFPWRLRHAVEAHERRWPVGRRLVRASDRALARRAGDPLADLAPALDLAAAAAALTPAERRLLRCRLLEDRRIEDAARRLGWSRRTAYRRWHALLDRLAASPWLAGGEFGPGGGAPGEPTNTARGKRRVS